MGLLTDLYNTVAKFFRPQEDTEDEASKSVATSRLKLVLMQDRTNLTPKILEQMRGELVDLLSKYLEMDKDLLELNFEQEGNQVALMLSIPVIRAKDEEEIEKALAEASANKSDESDSDEETDDDENSDSEEDTVDESGETEEVNDEEETDVIEPVVDEEEKADENEPIEVSNKEKQLTEDVTV